MNAIPEAPVTLMGTETEGGIPPNSQAPGQELTLSSDSFVEADGNFRGIPSGKAHAVRGLPDSFVDFPLPRDPAAGAMPPARKTDAEYAWLPPQPQMPPSPGAALVKEFDALYHKYERRVYRHCFRMVGNQEDAEDLTQEVFLQLYRKAHTFRGEANFSTWLHRLTINTVLMQMRRHRRWREAVTSLDVAPGAEEGVSDILSSVGTLPEPTRATLDRISLDVAIAQLSAGYKEIFLLHDAAGYRHEEIAKMLGISEGTSKSQLHKARVRLRELMGMAAGRS